MTISLADLVIPVGLDIPKPVVTCTIEGVIDEEDLRELALGVGPHELARQPEQDNPNDLKRLKEKHHHVARLAADGLQHRLIAQVCGYTENYISILLNNPAMIELVELYRIQSGAAVKIATEKLKTVGLKALEKLDAKIDADSLSNLELLSAAKLGLDRGGLGPQSKQVQENVHHVIDHARIKELNADARRRNTEYIVPADDVREAVALPAPKADEEPSS